jgi:hypothetical protein
MVDANTPLPAAIRQFVEATNEGDSEAFVDAFTDDASLDDWGRKFHGRDRIAEWNRTDNIGVRSHFEVVEVRAGDRPDVYVVVLTVSGDGFNGTGPMTFELRGGRIARLLITSG